jgi:hypothetical protein
MTSAGSSPPATSLADSTSSPPPEYPNSAKFSDSICFPQYTASLKCTPHFASLFSPASFFFFCFVGNFAELPSFVILVVGNLRIDSFDAVIKPESIEDGGGREGYLYIVFL